MGADVSQGVGAQACGHVARRVDEEECAGQALFQPQAGVGNPRHLRWVGPVKRPAGQGAKGCAGAQAGRQCLDGWSG